jgi:hypothetical protein
MSSISCGGRRCELCRQHAGYVRQEDVDLSVYRASLGNLGQCASRFSMFE